MRLTIQTAADYLRTKQAPKVLLQLLRRVRRLISFTREHENRLPRYIAVTNEYRRGAPVEQIATKFGCARGTVLRYARLADLPKRPKSFEAGIRSATIALYQQKKPIAEISVLLGVSEAYVSKTATEEGINRRNFKKRQKH